MKKFFRKTLLLVFAAVLSYGFMSCSDSGDEGNYYETSSVTPTPTPAGTYTVTFNANGGSGSMASQSFKSGVAQKLSTNTFTRDGYRFIGWAVTSSATTGVYEDGQSITVSSNMTLYAVWTESGNYRYVVKHLLQTSLTSDLYDEIDTVIDSGAAGSLTAAKANTYKNYTAQSFSQEKILDDDSTTIRIYYKLNSATGIKGLSYAVTDFGDLSISYLSGNQFVVSGDYVNKLLLANELGANYDLANFFAFYVNGDNGTALANMKANATVVVHNFTNGPVVYVTIESIGTTATQYTATAGDIVFAVMGPLALEDVEVPGYDENGNPVVNVYNVVTEYDGTGNGVWRSAACFVK